MHQITMKAGDLMAELRSEAQETPFVVALDGKPVKVKRAFYHSQAGECRLMLEAAKPAKKAKK